MDPRTILSAEKFVHIYDWEDTPGTVYELHSHHDKVTIFVTAGDVTFSFVNGTTRQVSSGQRFDVPPGIAHSAVVGVAGCKYIVGEMIEGDS